MRAIKVITAVVIAIVVGGGVLVAKTYWWNTWQTEREQEQLDAFYSVPDPIAGKPGDILRSEPAPQWDTDSGKATRMLYVTETEQGEKRVSGGLFWTPTAESSGERKVVAWGHGTTGLGNSCAPSRAFQWFEPAMPTIDQMLAAGWVVTATDYVGLGTPPQTPSYLIGQQESRDIVNSVRAVRGVKETNAGPEWAVFGTSQGGHASLWTGAVAPEYAPELQLTAVAAAVPAADLFATIDQQWDTPVSWAIGPEIVLSWPSVYPDLDLGIVNPGESTVEAEARDCIVTAGIMGLAREKFLGQKFFNSNPLQSAPWAKAMGTETPKPLLKLPVFIAQGTADEVVLANSNAALQEQWCKAGVDLTMAWLGGVKHQVAGVVAGPMVLDWFRARFAGQPTNPNCKEPPPVAPYEPEVEVPPIP